MVDDFIICTQSEDENTAPVEFAIVPEHTRMCQNCGRVLCISRGEENE